MFTREMRLGQLTQHAVAGDELEGAIFIGHLATDLDSIVAAIAAAELHRFPHKREQNQPGSPTSNGWGGQLSEQRFMHGCRTYRAGPWRHGAG